MGTDGPKKKDEPKKNAEPKNKDEHPEHYLQVSGPSNVELQETRGLLDLDGSFTVELWARWTDSYLKPQYLFGDFAFGNVIPELTGLKHSGLVLEAMAIEDANKRRLQLSIGMTVRGTHDWFQFRSAPMKDTENTWHHIAVVKSPATIRIFWNGKLAAEKGCKGVKFNGCPSNLFLGIRKGMPDGGFVGDIRAFRAYGKAVYAKPFTPLKEFVKTGSELILLDFTGEDKEKIADLSGKEHTGVFSNVKWAPKPKD